MIKDRFIARYNNHNPSSPISIETKYIKQKLLRGSNKNTILIGILIYLFQNQSNLADQKKRGGEEEIE